MVTVGDLSQALEQLFGKSGCVDGKLAGVVGKWEVQFVDDVAALSAVGGRELACLLLLAGLLAELNNPGHRDESRQADGPDRSLHMEGTTVECRRRI